MRAVRIPEFADPPGPVVVDMPTPEPGHGETLIELIAAEIAALDRQIAMGNLPGAGPLPIQPGATGVGRVLSSETLDSGGLVYVKPIVRLAVPLEEIAAGYAAVGGGGRVLLVPH